MAQGPSSKKRIMVVDDDAQMLDFVTEALESSGYEVTSAINGRDAITALTSSAFDVVITDIMMPERDGIELIQTARKAYPDTKIVAMSASDNQIYLRTARAFGAARVLVKPFGVNELLDTLDELFPA